MYHRPVLLNESVGALNITDGGKYADVTFGGGGHSAEILRRMKTGLLLGFDQDEDARQNILQDPNFLFVAGNFRYLKNYCKMNGVTSLNGILADLGVSSHQFDSTSRGFSIRYDADLNMRMDQEQELTARDILNTYTADNLQEMFSRYGEVSNAATLANRIVIERLKTPIERTEQFMEMIRPLVKWGKENQYYAQVFQALRIEVNEELEALKDLLEQSAELLVKGGRLVVISYHSLEDRLVKNFINKGKFKGEAEKDLYGNEIKPFDSVFRKAISPSAEEIRQNNRARSAKLRVGEKR